MTAPRALHNRVLSQWVDWRWRLRCEGECHLRALPAYHVPMAVWRIIGNHCSMSLGERKAKSCTGQIAIMHHHVRNADGDETLRSSLQTLRPKCSRRNERIPLQERHRGLLPLWREEAISSIGNCACEAAPVGCETIARSFNLGKCRSRSLAWAIACSSSDLP
jgi:hypothetical protein